MTRWHHTALHQALRRVNALENIVVMLDHGADPTLKNRWDGKTTVVIAACARNNAEGIRAAASFDPQLVREVLAEGGTLLAQFAGTANRDGVSQLLDLGVGVAALYKQGDAYFDIAENSTALHVAAWKGWHATVKLLIERGAQVDVLDGDGRTPLALAVKACVDSYWTYRRSPESVEALLRAGASTRGVALPCGYAEVDKLLSSQ